MTRTRKSFLAVCVAISMLSAVFVGVNALMPGSSAFAAYTDVMNNGDNPNRQLITTANTNGSNTFEHAMYFTAEGSDGQTYTSNYSSASPSVPDSILNLDKMTKGADGYYHFNGVVEVTAEKDVKSLDYIITLPASSSAANAPHIQVTGNPTFTGESADTIGAATSFIGNLPNPSYLYLHGALKAGQKITVSVPMALTNADSLDFTNTSSAILLNDSLGNAGYTPWGGDNGSNYTNKDLSAAGLRFAKTDSAAYSPYWAAYEPLKSDYENHTTDGIAYAFTVNNKISTNTSLDYTYTDVPQLPNSVVGLDASDYSFKNSDSSSFVPLTEMFAQGTLAYARNGLFRLNLDKVKKAYDGTGWSTNGMYTQYYTYQTNSLGLVIHGLDINDISRQKPLLNVELWHYLSTATNICLTAGQTFNPAQGINWVRPYNGAEVRDPLNDETQKKLIDITYTDAQGNEVSAPDTSKPGKYTVTYRYYSANNDGTRSTVSTSSKTRLYITADKAAACPPEETATISYDANQGQGTTPSQNVTYTDDKPGEATLAAGSELSREGYLLSSWNTAADGSGTTHALGSQLTGINAGVTLYAQWVKSEARIEVDNSKLVNLDPCTYSDDAIVRAISGVYSDDGSELAWSASDMKIDTSKVDFTKDGTYPVTVTYTKGTKAYPNGLTVSIDYTISGVAGCKVPAQGSSDKSAQKTVSTSGVSLAKTGADIVGFATVAAVLIVLGGSMVLMRRTHEE